MKSIALLLSVFALSFALTTGDAEAARRLGGGKSVGMQRSTIQPQKSATPPSAPAQSAATAPAPAPTQAMPQPAPKRSWMGPLAGLAAGIGLAALASHFGFGEQLASMMMIGLLVMAVVAVVGFIMRRRAQPAPAMAGNWSEPRDTLRPSPLNPAPAAPAASAPTGNIPADFDVEGFVRQAKVSFLRLQAANDTRNLEDIREFTTPEMFGEVKVSFMERGTAMQETDVTELNAQLLDVATEAQQHIASVRFTGTARIDRGAQIEAIDEIWHIVKPLDGSAGWRLAGIQQLQ